MPDLASQIEYNDLEDDALEPDEYTLITALRNQDDIPILMDIVADKLASLVSQENQFSDAMESVVLPEEESIPILSATEETESFPVMDEATENVAEDDHQYEANVLIAQAVSQVLEKRLPELVQEVLHAMNELSAQSKL